MVLLLPAERDDDLLVRYHLDELASGLVLTADEHPVDAAGARVDLGDGADPFDVLVGFGEEGPDRRRGGVDHELTDELVEEVAQHAHLDLPRLLQTPGSVASLAHEARRLEHPEVLRDRRARALSEV